MKVTVVGAGSWGVWSALELLAKGVDVQLIDLRGAGNDWSGSGGLSRIIRRVYGADKIYTELTDFSFEKWESLFHQTGDQLYHQTGVLWMQPSDESKYLKDSLELLSKTEYPLEEISVDEAAEKWNKINFTGIHKIYHEPRAGILEANKSCQHALYKFIEDGGSYKLGQVSVKKGQVWLDGKEHLQSEVIIFATGSWTRSLFPDVLDHITAVSRQEVYFYQNTGIDYADIPIWSELDVNGLSFYGFPPYGEMGLKIAYDSRDLEMDPETDPRELTIEIEHRSREYLEHRFRSADHAILQDYRVCHYDNSMDGHFIMDHHPEYQNMIILTGSSGHGFKMGPAIGHLVADHVVDGKDMPGDFRLARFEHGIKKKTQFTE